MLYSEFMRIKFLEDFDTDLTEKAPWLDDQAKQKIYDIVKPGEISDAILNNYKHSTWHLGVDEITDIETVVENLKYKEDCENISVYGNVQFGTPTDEDKVEFDINKPCCWVRILDTYGDEDDFRYFIFAYSGTI